MTWSVPVPSPPPPPPASLPPLQGEPDPVPTGRAIAIACWILILLLATTLLTLTTVREHKELSTSNTDPPSLQFELPARILIAEAVKTPASNGATTAPASPVLSRQLIVQTGESAKTPSERLAMVTVLYECQGKAAALNQLELDRPSFAGSPKLSAAADILQKLYNTGPDSIDTGQQIALKKQLGWFGDLALTQGKTGPDPGRAQLLAQAKKAETGAIAAGGGMVLVGLMGITAAVMAVVFFAVGLIRPAMVRPSPGGPPRLLVLFTIWIYGFMGFSVLLRFLPVDLPLFVHELIGLGWTGLVVWLPSMRGTTWPRWRQTLGLHTGRGLAVEMLCGVFGYLAGLPLLGVAFAVFWLLSKLSPIRSNHPVAEDLAGPMSVVRFLGLFLVLSVMAPVIEETVFRGALYGHMRRRWGPVVSVVVVAVIFAAIHPQGWEAIPLLAAIAVVLGLLREWRGSLVASITAHGLNNFLVLLVGVTISR